VKVGDERKILAVLASYRNAPATAAEGFADPFSHSGVAENATLNAQNIGRESAANRECCGGLWTRGQSRTE
jgi:hypothetical protein